MALTKITKGVIKPNENYDTHNINSTGVITATSFHGDGANLTGIDASAICLLYTSPSPRDLSTSRMPSSA